MRTQSFLLIIIASAILSACNTKPQSAYFSHDLQMETLKGKINRVDYNFYKDRDCYKRYYKETPYSLVYDDKGNLVSDSRYMSFEDVERDENGFFIHVNTGNVVSAEHHTEWDMIELSYSYDEQGFMTRSFKAGMGDDCGERIYFYEDSLPSKIVLGENGGTINYDILEIDDHNNWTLARVNALINHYDMDGEFLSRTKEHYYVQRIIMYSQESK